ncbi:replication-associated recombination protein A [Candidatus Gottesmanbacteria bacterium]|nr:replication-associated recombination protein A [Candidatus Gottesmanbacteria bacterium]
MNIANLAERMRPKNLEKFLGQEDLVGENKLISRIIQTKQPFSLIFWGPPGSGKTTLAKIIAKSTEAEFFSLSAVSAGKSELTEILKNAKENLKTGKRTILFIDEIHRWNKAQQAFLLPHVEQGIIILIGATTENPSFEVISPLLSRCRVFVLEPLSRDNLEKLLDRALTDKEDGLGKYQKTLSEEGKLTLLRLSGGDARILLNALEMAVLSYPQKIIDEKIIKEVFQKKTYLYDKKAEEHYNAISAFIKSLRGSDPNASLYYMLRILEVGEDPKFIARRMIILASEDIGLADRGALIIANAGFEAVEKIGLPEAKLILCHIAIYLAKAPKSRLVAKALSAAEETVLNFPDEPIPLHLRNAPTKLMKELGFAKDYLWSEQYVGPIKPDLGFLPERLKDKKFVAEK